MKLAIMQPYFFPYIGYFQLINAVDKFVFYDDVNFIKGGWINRNRIIINGEPKFISVPVKNMSSFRKTCNTEINIKQFSHWKIKFFKTLEQHYAKSPFFKEVFPIIKEVFEEDSESIGELAKRSIQKVLSYLKIEKTIVWSSEIYENSDLKREERILNICIAENAQFYFNLIGGLSIYDKKDFSAKDVQLQFLKTIPKKYEQSTKEFIPSLSIIDVLMNNSKEDVIEMLKDYELV